MKSRRQAGRQAGRQLLLGLLFLIACSSHDDPVGQTSAAVVPAASDGGDGASTAPTAPSTPQTASYVGGSFYGDIAGGYGTVIGAGDESPWVVGNDKNVYHFNNDYSLSRTWIQEPNSGNTSSLAVSPEGTPWKLDTSGNVAERTGPGTWSIMGSGFLAYEIGVGASAQYPHKVWAIGRNNCDANGDCPIYYWTAGRAGYWQQTSGAARHVAVAPDGTAYVSNHNGTLFKWNGSSWQSWPGSGCVRNPSNHSALDDHLGWPVIGAADNDAIWVIGCSGDGVGNNYVYAWHTQNSFWEQIPNGGGTSISVSADGTAWLINAGTNIFEYHTTWQPVGPAGFSFTYQGVNEIWTGELRDVNAAPSGTVTVAALSGGVWRNPFTWVPIADVGAGVNARSGPSNSVGTVAVKPNNDKVVVVGTGVFDPNGNNGPNKVGNGAWYTSDASVTTVLWSQSSFYDSNIPPQPINPPSSIVRIRYSADSTTVYLITPQALFASDDDGHTFYQQDSSCTPQAGGVFTDLVVDPNDPTRAYIGVTAEGVYQYHYSPGHPACNVSNPAPPLGQGPVSSITYVALAMASSGSRLYAAFAGQVFAGGDDFENIDTTTTATWNQQGSWTTAVPESQFAQCNPNPPPSCNPDWNTCTPTTCCCPYGLNSQGGHNWALGTDPTGTIVLIGGGALWRGAGCGIYPCTSFSQINPYPDTVTTPDHHDYHAITWAGNGAVYVVNDGGIFYSSDSGQTWSAQLNNLLGVADEMGVGVNGTNIFAAAWDVGVNMTTNGGTSWQGDDSTSTDLGIFSADTRQAIADLNHSGYGYVCSAGNQRGFWNGTQWSEIDNVIGAQNPCNMASSLSGSLFTIAVTNQQHVFQSVNQGQVWSAYGDPLTQPVVSLVASNEFPASVYAVTTSNTLIVCNQCGGSGTWGSPITMPWPAGYGFANPGTKAGNAIATDWLSSDFYAVGNDSSQRNARVLKSAQSAHGSSWTQLTGTVPQGTPGVPGMLKQDELVQTITIDSSSRTLLVGTDGTAPTTSAIYGAATIWRLNNADVLDDYHHWRPWVNGLPVGTQDINWLTGQYENGVFYIYAATWGRGIWKREARGGDL